MRAHPLMAALAVTGMLASGYSPTFEFRPRSRPRYMREDTLEEIEADWVKQRMRLLRLKRRQAAHIIEGLAKAFGPWAHRFGFKMPHPQSREIARRLRQEARRAAKRANA
jgi:hypothetical protein